MKSGYYVEFNTKSLTGRQRRAYKELDIVALVEETHLGYTSGSLGKQEGMVPTNYHIMPDVDKVFWQPGNSPEGIISPGPSIISWYGKRLKKTIIGSLVAGMLLGLGGSAAWAWRDWTVCPEPKGRWCFPAYDRAYRYIENLEIDLL